MTANSTRPKTADAGMEALHKTYSKLRATGIEWQQQRGEHWAPLLLPQTARPYLPLSQLPEAPVLELAAQMLADLGRACSPEDLIRFWQAFRLEQLGTAAQSESERDTELGSILVLALSAVFALARLQLPTAPSESHSDAEAYSCPVCAQVPGISLITPPAGKRLLHCTRCGHEWPGMRVGCIRCGSENASDQTYLQSEDFPGTEVVVCQACSDCFKEFDLREFQFEDFSWEDIRTLPLNFAADKWLASKMS